MTEEEKKKLLEEGKTETEIMHLEKIAEMKEKMDQMIDPEKFKELQAEYKKLLDEYVNKRIPPKKEEETLRPTKEIAKDLIKVRSSDITNRDYIKTALEYRKAHIKETGRDPFTDFGESGPQEPNEQTNKIASTLEKLLEENETPTSFRIALNEVLKDDPKLISKLRRNTA